MATSKLFFTHLTNGFLTDGQKNIQKNITIIMLEMVSKFTSPDIDIKYLQVKMDEILD